MSDLVPVPEARALTAKQFGDLADVPPELEWLANITNLKTRLAYKDDVNGFSHFAGLRSPIELRGVTRAHVIAWRKELEVRALSPATIRRKLAALSSLFDYLCERNAVAGNPVDGVKRPLANGNEGSTPALGDGRAVRGSVVVGAGGPCQGREARRAPRAGVGPAAPPGPRGQAALLASLSMHAKGVI